ncbi:MAG: carboxymuconolactone decarboxylase family protein [Dehalococcoidia bacterium]|nr:MAG: carboxymuconolactone decarboxylase family protein [Dehalococcoidia bacterium]
MDTNAAGSSAAGASDEKIAAIDSFRTSDLFTPAESAALELAEAMSRTPADVSDATFEAVRRHFDEPQLVELVATIAMENYRARFNRAFDVEAQGLCQVRGVKPPTQLMR